MNWNKILLKFSKFKPEDQQDNSHILWSLTNKKRSFKHAIDAMDQIYDKLNYKLSFIQKENDHDLIKITYWLKLQKVSWFLLRQKLNKIMYDNKYKNSNFFYVLKTVFETHLDNGTPYFMQLENNLIWNKFSRGNFGRTAYEFLSTYAPEFSQSEFNKNKITIDFKNVKTNQFNKNRNNNKPFKNNNKTRNKNNKTTIKENTKTDGFPKLLNNMNIFFKENEINDTAKNCVNYWFNPIGCKNTSCTYDHNCPFKKNGCNKTTCKLNICEFAKSTQNYNKWLKTFGFK